MKEHGTLIDEHTVQFERLVPGPIERAWAFLVESDKRAQWLCAGETQLKVGGTAEMHFRHASLAGQAGVVDEKPAKYVDMPECISFSGTVTRCNPPYELAYSWDFGGEESEVCYELSEKAERVLLLLTHTRLGAGEQVSEVSAGWHTHLDILVAVLEGTEPRPFWQAHGEHEAVYEKRFKPGA